MYISMLAHLRVPVSGVRTHVNGIILIVWFNYFKINRKLLTTTLFLPARNLLIFNLVFFHLFIRICFFLFLFFFFLLFCEKYLFEYFIYWHTLFNNKIIRYSIINLKNKNNNKKKVILFTKNNVVICQCRCISRLVWSDMIWSVQIHTRT